MHKNKNPDWKAIGIFYKEKMLVFLFINDNPFAGS